MTKLPFLASLNLQSLLPVWAPNDFPVKARSLLYDIFQNFLLL